jgi:hypothetical protein
MKNFIIIFMILVSYGYTNNIYYYKDNQKITIIPIISLSRNNLNIDYYQNDKGIKLGVTNKLIVKLEDAINLEQVLIEFKLILEKKLSKNLYLLKTANKNLTIDISNRLSEKEYIKYAHPDFIKKRKFR